MKRKKGQALVEFIIILPIFIFMLLATIDIGKIIYNKNRLESEMSTVVDFYKNGKTYDEITKELEQNDIHTILEIQNEDNKRVTFTLKKEVSIVTPGLSILFENPYSVTVSRVIGYE